MFHFIFGPENWTSVLLESELKCELVWLENVLPLFWFLLSDDQTFGWCSLNLHLLHSSSSALGEPHRTLLALPSFVSPSWSFLSSLNMSLIVESSIPESFFFNDLWQNKDTSKSVNALISRNIDFSDFKKTLKKAKNQILLPWSSTSWEYPVPWTRIFQLSAKDLLSLFLPLQEEVRSGFRGGGCGSPGALLGFTPVLENSPRTRVSWNQYVVMYFWIKCKGMKKQNKNQNKSPG